MKQFNGILNDESDALINQQEANFNFLRDEAEDYAKSSCSAIFFFFL